MELIVDQKSIRMNAFVQDIVCNVIRGMIRSLDDVPDEPEIVTFTLQESAAVTLMVNGQTIGINDFVQTLAGRIIHGILHSLHGVPAYPETVMFRMV
jgi:hypothetical protein